MSYTVVSTGTLVCTRAARFPGFLPAGSAEAAACAQGHAVPPPRAADPPPGEDHENEASQAVPRHTLHPPLQKSYRHFAHAPAHPFDAAARSMTRLNAWWLAEAALLSYWPADAALPIFQRAGLEGQRLDAGTTNCYVAWKDDWALVVFRGTQPDQWGDILDDLRLPPVAWTHGSVHGGFEDAFSRIRPALEARLQSIASGRSVWFCGHSLGGALATLAAHWWPGSSGVCTLGAPRVGTRHSRRRSMPGSPGALGVT